MWIVSQGHFVLLNSRRGMWSQSGTCSAPYQRRDLVSEGMEMRSGWKGRDMYDPSSRPSRDLVSRGRRKERRGEKEILRSWGCHSVPPPVLLMSLLLTGKNENERDIKAGSSAEGDLPGKGGVLFGLVLGRRGFPLSSSFHTPSGGGRGQRFEGLERSETHFVGDLMQGRPAGVTRCARQ